MKYNIINVDTKLRLYIKLTYPRGYTVLYNIVSLYLYCYTYLMFLTSSVLNNPIYLNLILPFKLGCSWCGNRQLYCNN